jgi:hypothetical protein
VPRRVRFPRRPPVAPFRPSKLDLDVAEVMRWLRDGKQDRGILAQKTRMTDRRMRKAIEEARRRGELVITTPGPLHMYVLADSRGDYLAWRHHELMSRMGTFGQQLRAMDAAADRRWPAEQMRMAL